MKKTLIIGMIAVAGSAVAETDDAYWAKFTNLRDINKAPVRCRPLKCVKDMEPSLVPNGSWKLVWHDEFEGNSVDTNKWIYRDHFWGEKVPWFDDGTKGCAEVSDGTLKLKLKKFGDQYVTAQLATGENMWDKLPKTRKPWGKFWPLEKREKAKFLKKFGYFECRAKLQKKRGWNSAFWLQTETQGCSLNPGNSGIEEDIMESWYPGCIMTHAHHYNGYGADYRGFNNYRLDVRGEKSEEFDFTVARLDTDSFHRFGMLWEEDGYTVYIDGHQSGYKVGTAPGEAVSKVEQFVLLTTEAMWYRKAARAPVADLEGSEGDQFEVDYVRVFDRTDVPAPESPNANFNAPDLSKITGAIFHRKPDVTVVRGGRAVLPIVANSRWRYGVEAANYLADVIKEMTGVRPPVYVEDARNPVNVRPAFYVSVDGSLSEERRVRVLAAAGMAEELPTADVRAEEFVVAPRDGSIWFLGRGDHAVYDFCERVLGSRQYWETKDGGRAVVKTKGLRVRQIEWRDRPVFDMRANYPYWASQWGRSLRDSNFGPVSRYPTLHVHPTDYLNTNFNWKATDPDVFEINADGQRNNQLCYGNPKTLEKYKELVDWYISRDRGGSIVDRASKTVTISQLDQGVHCHCGFCQKLYDPKMGDTGNASPCIWGFFAKGLSTWMKAKYPDWRIVLLPYHNTCGCPEGLTFPEGNVYAMLCTMPGLAMLKNDNVRDHEEELIRKWAKATGNRVENWHYSCWPAEFTCAPYVYGKVCQDHYRRMRDVCLGSFLNGGTDLHRFALSVSVWMKCLWNPDFNLSACYDKFAETMFGPAAKPMRALITLQEKGWMRQWKSVGCSNKNVHEVSYPRQEVLEMEKHLAEAEQLVAGYPEYAARFEYYRAGFAQFLKDSADHANGTGFEPLYVKKASEQPKIDGILDDPTWHLATPMKFVAAYQAGKVKGGVPKAAIRPDEKPIDGGEVRAVWTSEGVTFGFRCDEHAIGHFQNTKPFVSFANETFDMFIDPSGEGEDEVYQLVIDARGALCPLRAEGRPAWKCPGAKQAFHVDREKKEWSAELFIPYADLKDFNGARFPTTSANGVVWSGNVTRWRVGDSALPKGEKPADAHWEASRLWTRSNWWNKDSTAFGKFVFVE